MKMSCRASPEQTRCGQRACPRAGGPHPRVHAGPAWGTWSCTQPAALPSAPPADGPTGAGFSALGVPRRQLPRAHWRPLSPGPARWRGRAHPGASDSSVELGCGLGAWRTVSTCPRALQILTCRRHTHLSLIRVRSVFPSPCLRSRQSPRQQ